jgi:hemoglobin
MAAHFHIHGQRPFTAEHFVRWLELFHDALDANWQGENVDRMKHLALNVAKVHSKQLGLALPG